jgi:heme oxygenase
MSPCHINAATLPAFGALFQITGATLGGEFEQERNKKVYEKM